VQDRESYPCLHTAMKTGSETVPKEYKVESDLRIWELKRNSRNAIRR
jgi:hypothetical protein